MLLPISAGLLAVAALGTRGIGMLGAVLLAYFAFEAWSASRRQLPSCFGDGTTSLLYPKESTGALLHPQMQRRLARIVEVAFLRTNFLDSYRPTPWLKGAPLLAVVFAMARWQLRAILRRGPRVKRESLAEEPDLFLDWNDCPRSRALGADAPILAILVGITGETSGYLEWLAAAADHGYRGVILVRRGHGGPLHKPCFNPMGDADDTTLMIAAVKRKYPKAFVGLVGISAGSGQAALYVGKSSNCAIDAGLMMCPAWDIDGAFQRVERETPFVARSMVQDIKRLFVIPNAELLRTYNARAYDALVACESLDDILYLTAPFALQKENATREDYSRHSNPMRWYQNACVPFLMVNSADDMVCLPTQVRDSELLQHGSGALLCTRYGSHCAFNEGYLGLGNFLHRVTFAWLDGARAVAAEDGRVQ